ncbi:BZ3500_MvSof-1268-A1-R1_Chr1-2g01457 [Microbotryum saponariae]|uniref:BZ3500_MvSof-1268-A1-R1_Chr1-2g01457 protein n=1 Tax=Microbotryum saponariae TaxID=289078 RepID=A0A2X0MYR9_9BASI|nr:BZ3500_MvSof-1268-A1-R1_Chr1-2g01457 [Microbotryum saponariae]SCZ97465.1 BZ3501_MvSof-1269-A2-R1_Chr1-2g01056 [Microbotryum saponariae]
MKLVFSFASLALTIVYLGGAAALPVVSKSGHEATQGLEPTAATVTVHDLTATSQSTPQHQEYEGESKFISIGKIFHKIGIPVPVGKVSIFSQKSCSTALLCSDYPG